MIQIDLSGQVALITGAGQGIGAATAKLLHEAGATVAINYFEDPAGVNRQRAEQTAAALGGRAFAVAADVRDLTAVTAMVNDVIARAGRLDIVVNNAGILRDRTLKNMTRDDWDAVVDTNLGGVFNVCKAACEKLADGGRIVNLASIAAILGFFGQTNYAAAKAGVMGITRVLSKELGRRRIRVNAIAPGVIQTEMAETIPADVRAKMLENIPLRRLGEASEIAGAILFLCSDLSSYVSGQTLQVNGGWVGN